MNKKLKEQLDDYLAEVLIELYGPTTGDLVTELMEDPEKMQDSYSEVMVRVKKYFEDEWDIEIENE